MTKVVNDLTGSNTAAKSTVDFGLAGSYVLAGVALVVSVAALLVKRK